METESKTIVVTAIPNPDGQSEMQQYLSGVIPVLAKNGGKPVFRGKAAKAISGELSFGLIMMMRFESEAKIEAAFASAEYQALLPLRDRGFKMLNITMADDLDSSPIKGGE